MTSTSHKSSVLILEDDMLILIDLEAELADCGYGVADGFRSCNDAISWLEKNSPIFAILDPMVKDGHCRDIIQKLDSRGIPWMIYSVLSEPHDDYPSAVWVSKPASSFAIPEAIAMLMDEARDQKTG